MFLFIKLQKTGLLHLTNSRMAFSPTDRRSLDQLTLSLFKRRYAACELISKFLKWSESANLNKLLEP